MSAAGRDPLSGTAYELQHGSYAASIAGVGASLRQLIHSGRHLVVPFEADEVRPAFRGAILAPWPNRVVDGRYVLDGQVRQLALTEPERNHALHGLLVWQEFAPEHVEENLVRLSATIPAQAGYPHLVKVSVEFILDDTGLLTTVTGLNAGPSAAPWGTAPHPYLVAGPGPVDGWTLELPARQVLTVTPDRLIPVELAPVAAAEGVRYDFRTPRLIGDTLIDHAYTDLEPDDTGTTRVRLTDPAGRGVQLSWDQTCGWVQIHTADRPSPEPSRIGLAVEPMTCAPDAYNSGLGLVMLAPGESHTAAWRLSAI